MEKISPKLFTLLALRECAPGARTTELERAYQDAFMHRLFIIGSIVSGEPRPRGFFVRPGELARVGLTPDDALEHYKMGIAWLRVGQYHGQHMLKGDAPIGETTPFAGGN